MVLHFFWRLPLQKQRQVAFTNFRGHFFSYGTAHMDNLTITHVDPMVFIEPTASLNVDMISW